MQGDCYGGCGCQSGFCILLGNVFSEVCDGEDQSCNGVIDEGFNVGDLCNTNMVVCSIGMLVCGDFGIMECVVLDCDDGNSCMDDVCDGVGGCTSSLK